MRENVKDKLIDLVNESYTQEQMVQVKDIIANNKQGHFMNYSILAAGIDNDSLLSKENVIEFYGAGDESSEWLTPVDFVIANIITSLSDLLNEDIKQGFEDSIELDKSEPEFQYLLNKVEEYLNGGDK